MDECEHLERTSAYFDGALAPEAEAEALAHVAECAECQELLGAAVAIDAALSTGVPSDRQAPERAHAGPAPVPARARRPRRRWGVAAALVAAAAGVALWLGLRSGDPERPAVVAIELAGERTIEARFSGPSFAPHRPLRVLRGDVAREAISLQAMAALERAGDRHDLVAALVASGDLVRARESAATLAPGPARESDLAAIALAAGEPELALQHAYHALDADPALASARWNLALAARELGLPRVARAELERVVEAAEPGWAAEARAQLAALARELAGTEAHAIIDRRGREMLAGGPALIAEDIELSPAQVRIHFYDAVRLADSTARIDALRPLAQALDAASGTTHATAALDRASPELAARFGARYRTLIEQRAGAPGIPALLDELRAAGPAARFLLAGAIVLANQELERWQELRELVAPWDDPWFDLLVERERIRAIWPGGDLRAIQPLEAALARCTNTAWALRCGLLALDLAQLLDATGSEVQAVRRGEEAIEWYRRAGLPALQTAARTYVAEPLRRRGRTARARAEFEEIVLASSGPHGCDVRRYARIGQAAIAIVDRDLAAAHRYLPPAAPPEGCSDAPDLIGLTTAVDLARLTGTPEDVAAARRWIEITRAVAEPVAIVGAARIGRGADAEASRQLEDWLARTASSDDPLTLAVRTWGITTLISDAGAREAWDQVLAVAAAAPRLAQASCVVVASADDGDTTIALRAKGAIAGVHHRAPPRELEGTPLVPPELARALAGCADIAVVARPPLHGRADLLPAHLPWWFAGDGGSDAEPRTRRTVEVIDARPPDATLPRLLALPAGGFEVSLAGDAATPRRVLAALADASYAELHVHGIASASEDDAAYLALSPDVDGTFALRADAVRTSKLRNAPLIVLGACRAAQVAPYLRQRWSLPDAFLAAGARAIVAVDVPIPDAGARPIFDELRRRIDAGEPVAAAVAAIRASAPADAAWARRLMVFR